MNRLKKNAEKGVTLIEMLVVVTIIGLFVALVAPNLFKHAAQARRVAAREQINSFMSALISYNGDTGVFPTNDQGLQALRVKPENASNWGGPYLMKDLPLDPWNHPYVYKYPGEHGDTPEITSYGADGQPGGDGDNADIVSWNNK